jgi:hypothetical protein
MEGVTTTITGFIFVCVIWPGIVKSKPQFYSSIGLLMLIVLFDGIGHMGGDEKSALFQVMYLFAALLQMLTILILVMCVGGLSPRELASEVSDTIDAIRHGGKQKSVPPPPPLKDTRQVPKEPEPRSEEPAQDYYSRTSPEPSLTIDAVRQGGEQKSVLPPFRDEQPIPKEPEPPLEESDVSDAVATTLVSRARTKRQRDYSRRKRRQVSRTRFWWLLFLLFNIVLIPVDIRLYHYVRDWKSRHPVIKTLYESHTVYHQEPASQPAP